MKRLIQLGFLLLAVMAGTRPGAACNIPHWDSGAQLVIDINACFAAGFSAGTRLSVSGNGGSTIPSLSSCGSNPVINGTDTAFEVVCGTGATSCKVTFSQPFTSSNVSCVATDDGQPISWEVGFKGPSGFTLQAFQGSTLINCAGQFVNVICLGFTN